MVVDFDSVMQTVPSSAIIGAWFREVSPRVRAAGIHGDQIQRDKWFARLLNDGRLSNLSFVWSVENVEHKVMITSTGAVCLVQDYKSNRSLELTIAMDVYHNILKRSWSSKKKIADEDGLCSDDDESDLIDESETDIQD